jgi:DNA polymerase-3 subunit alpha
VLAYIKDRFGHDNVAQIVTFSGLKAKAILKDLFNLYGVAFEDANYITSLIPAKNEDHTDITIQDALDKVPELRIMETKYKGIFSIAKNLEGCYKTTGVHAAGVVISDVPFDESSYPLARDKSGEPLFGWDMDDVDNLHLLKLDILGLSTLDDIQITRDLIKKNKGVKTSRETMPLNDPVTFSLFEQGLMTGVFQVEKQLGKTWSKAIKPQTVTEISDVVSLIRPATLDSGTAEQYRKVKNKEADFKPVHDLLAHQVKDTYGILLYQEQQIEACRVLARLSLIEADNIRKAIGKKKPEELKKWKSTFIDGCTNNGIATEKSEEIWNILEKAAGYSFNFSHGLSYAMLSYEAAYLKANYPLEFFCAKMRGCKSDFDKLKSLVYDAKLFDIDIIPPSIQRGNKDFDIIDDKTISFGLSALKGVGAAGVQKLVAVSKKCDDPKDIIYKSLESGDKVSSAILEVLIKSGCIPGIRIRILADYKILSQLTPNERKILYAVDRPDWIMTIRDMSDESKFELLKDQTGLRMPNVSRRQKIREYLLDYDSTDFFDSDTQNASWERQYLGVCLSKAEEDLYTAQNKCIDIVRHGYADMKCEISVHVENVKQILTKHSDEMAFLVGSDDTYMIDNIVVFPKIYANHKSILEKGNVLKLFGKLDNRHSFIAYKIEKVK